MSSTSRLKAGRRWSANASGVTSVTRTYLFVRDADPSGADTEEVRTLAGLPAIGTKHPDNDNLVVTGYEFEEGDDNGKRLIVATVKFEQETRSWTAGEGETPSSSVEQWGWSSSFVSRDLAEDAESGLTVLNSAGEPFDSVPQIDHPVLTFTKVCKFKARQTGWLGHIGKVNGGEVTVGGLKCPAYTLRVTGVDEEHLFFDPNGFRYKYTISLQYLSNTAAINGNTQKVEIGWDVSVVDQGLHERIGSELKRITDEDKDGNVIPVSLPVLLNGEGARATGTTPYLIRIHAYETTTIPAAFYSEPGF